MRQPYSAVLRTVRMTPHGRCSSWSTTVMISVAPTSSNCPYKRRMSGTSLLNESPKRSSSTERERPDLGSSPWMKYTP